jgi:hypothetical protein
MFFSKLKFFVITILILIFIIYLYGKYVESYHTDIIKLSGVNKTILYQNLKSCNNMSMVCGYCTKDDIYKSQCVYKLNFEIIEYCPKEGNCPNELYCDKHNLNLCTEYFKYNSIKLSYIKNKYDKLNIPYCDNNISGKCKSNNTIITQSCNYDNITYTFINNKCVNRIYKSNIIIFGQVISFSLYNPYITLLIYQIFITMIILLLVINYKKFAKYIPIYKLQCCIKFSRFLELPYRHSLFTITCKDIINITMTVITYVSIILCSFVIVYRYIRCIYLYKYIDNMEICEYMYGNIYIIFPIILLVLIHHIINCIIYENFIMVIINIISIIIVIFIGLYINVITSSNDIYPVYLLIIILGATVPILYPFARHFIFVSYNNYSIETTNIIDIVDNNTQDILMEVVEMNDNKLIEDENIPNENIPNDELCSICIKNKKQYLFSECGHKCICKDCIKHINICPLCRKSGNKIFVYD